MGRFLFLLEHIWCRCFNLPVIHSDRYLCCTAVGNVFWGSTGFVLGFTAAEVKTLLLLLMLLAQENNSRRYQQYETAWKPILPLDIFENRTNCIVTILTADEGLSSWCNPTSQTHKKWTNIKRLKTLHQWWSLLCCASGACCRWQGRRYGNCKSFWLLDKQRENVDCKKELEESLQKHPALSTLVAWTLPVLMFTCRGHVSSLNPSSCAPSPTHTLFVLLLFPTVFSCIILKPVQIHKQDRNQYNTYSSS
jgi:hypothetical protein